MNSFIKLISILGLIAITTGCAMTPDVKSASSKYMQMQSVPVSVKNPESANIIFLRPSVFGWLISAPVFELQGETEKLVGISTYGTSITYSVEPGKHTFMVIGESADFMEANVDAGKTYYALVTPRMGLWKARFTLHPVHAESTFTFNKDHKEFPVWKSSAQPITLLPNGLDWQKENQTSISGKRKEYYLEWINKVGVEHDTYVLKNTDGI